MSFLFLCNLRPSCIQEKHRNIKIYVHIGVDIVNFPLIIKRKSCLLVTDPTKQNLCLSLKIFTALIRTLALHLKKRKENYTKTTQIAQTVRHIGSPNPSHMPLKTLDKTLSLQHSFFTKHPGFKVTPKTQY